MELADIRQAIIEDVANRDFTNKGIAPFPSPFDRKNSHYWTGTWLRKPRKRAFI